MKNTLPWLHKLTLVALLTLGCLLYTGLGRDYLFEWDEAIYGELGREMVADHDLLTSHWNHELWLEKPPLISYATALGSKIVADPELGARLFMPVFALLTLYAVLRVGEYLGGTILGATAVGMLGYFNLFLSRARTVNSDGMLLAAISWTVWLALFGSSPWLVGLVAGLAVLAKGPAGLLSILIALPLLFNKPKKYLLLATCFFLLTVLPWHLYQLLVHGSAFYTPYFLEQVLRRATVPIEFHMESRWFYFIQLYQELGIGILLAATLGLIFIRRSSLVLAVWALLPIALFTLAKTRLSWYILPAYPGIALLIGLVFSRLAQNYRAKTVTLVLVVGMLAQMLMTAYQYVAPTKATAPLPDHIVVAQALAKNPGDKIAYLVSSSERTAQAILPAEQAISSSFRYGGAPSVVFYSGKTVKYYYNYDNFTADLITDPLLTLAITTPTDAVKVPPNFHPIVTTEGYIGFARGEIYAQR